MAYESVTTYKARAERALLCFQDNTYWIGLGRSTPWNDENNPPAPSASATDIEEAIVFVRADVVQLCKPVPADEDVTYLGQGYQFVNAADAIAEGARWLYVKGEFHPLAGQSYGTYRQIGIFSNLIPAAGHEADEWLDPANVTAPGLLENLSNGTSVIMDLTHYELIPQIIEFR